MTRCRTDLRYHYGILSSKSQTSLRNATQAGSKEGRLFSQATKISVILGYIIMSPTQVKVHALIELLTSAGPDCFLQTGRSQRIQPKESETEDLQLYDG